LFCHVGKKFGLPIADCQGGATPSEEQGGVSADSLGRPGHDGDSVGEQD
jgi:hypothetical protein